MDSILMYILIGCVILLIITALIILYMFYMWLHKEESIYNFRDVIFTEDEIKELKEIIREELYKND
jgi:hypothetical protein